MCVAVSAFIVLNLRFRPYKCTTSHNMETVALVFLVLIGKSGRRNFSNSFRYLFCPHPLSLLSRR